MLFFFSPDADSDNETISKVSGAAGSDSWADSPDVSVSGPKGKVSLAVSAVRYVLYKRELISLKILQLFENMKIKNDQQFCGTENILGVP